LGDGLIASDASGRTTIIPDYADFVGGAAGMPEENPQDLLTELAALDVLLRIEEERFLSRDTECEASSLILVDRSVLTLSWHCAGLDRMAHHGASFQSVVDSRLRADRRARWPDLVIYLDVSHSTQLMRNRGKFDLDSVFMDPDYNSGFCSGFAAYVTADVAVPCVRIQADREPESVLADARRFLSEEGAL
jgi:thymidylate kinase